jgi:hypothetical protein
VTPTERAKSIANESAKVAAIDPLFEHMSNEYGLVLFDSELHEIVRLARQCEACEACECAAAEPPARHCSPSDPAYSDEPGHVLIKLGDADWGMTVEKLMEHVKWCLRALADACETAPGAGAR